jgi:DNA polymerase III gamma/tau subunit
MNITVNIQAPELARAIESLAAALTGKKETEFQQIVNQGIQTIQSSQQQVAATNVPVQQAPIAQIVPTIQPAPTAQQQPIQPAPIQAVPTQQPVQQVNVQQTTVQQPQSVPTSAPSYNMDQLAVAATQLVDAGKRENLVQLLNSFGAQALMQLPKEQYGAFATKLREMGAKI